MTETGKGILAMVVTCVIWGISGFYFKALAHIPPEEILAHRTVWSFVFFFGILLAQRRIGALRDLLRSRRVWQIALAAVMISLNWFFFIYCVQIGRALSVSLGYYIFPLVAVLLGVILFRERLRTGHAIAVILAAVAVTTLTVGLGAAPWISLLLATTFGLYGVVKKGLDVGPLMGVTAEVALLAPLGLIWLIGVHTMGWEGLTGRNLGAFGTNWHDTLLLAFSGVWTAVPLLLFSYAARRLSYGLVGLLEYINPTLQFLVAALFLGELVTPWHMIALPIIWVALAIYSWVTLSHERAESKRAARVATSGTT
ncbi:MAG: EamA family transporter RarD [Pseudomonadota bacterium]|nr:EamA family transporter RarD [Pseudomonadota bacterium]